MKETRQFIWTYAKIIFALFILGVAINMFLGPHHIAAGGVSGLGILLEAAFGFDRAIVILVLNIVMLVLALLFLGKKPFFKVLFGSLVFPLIIAVVPEMMITSDRLLSVIFGSAIFALGVAILYKNNSSSGGTTIPPLVFKKYFHLNTSIGLFLTDAFVVSLNLLLIVVTDHEFSRMKPLIEEIDPSAFVIVNSVAEVMGRGFTYHPIE